MSKTSSNNIAPLRSSLPFGELRHSARMIECRAMHVTSRTSGLCGAEEHMCTAILYHHALSQRVLSIRGHTSRSQRAVRAGFDGAVDEAKLASDLRPCFRLSFYRQHRVLAKVMSDFRRPHHLTRIYGILGHETTLSRIDTGLPQFSE